MLIDTERFELIQQHLDKLGRRVTDRVTGFQGVVTSISFDLYGCVQAIITPPASSTTEQEKCRWMDLARLEVEEGDPVMQRPDFLSKSRQAEGRQGAAEKPEAPEMPLP